MKQENSVSVFIFLLIANLYLAFVVSSTPVEVISIFGQYIAFLTFGATLLGLFITSLKDSASRTGKYYLLLFFTSMIIFAFKLLEMNVDTVIQYYFVLAILVALLLSLVDYRQYVFERAKEVARYKLMTEQMESDVNDLNTELKKQKFVAETYKERALMSELEVKKAEKEMVKLQSDASRITRELIKSESRIEEYNLKIDSLKDKVKGLSDDKKQMGKLKKEQKALEKELNKSQKEIEKQTELKKKYSLTLTKIRKKKKAEQELLVVSLDGTSVHKPKCIAVRNIPKDNRKLIANWDTAKKEGYSGCKLCNPHIKPKVIVNSAGKFKFLASKGSDKIHTASCPLVRNIDPKDRDYFRTYKAALKKGYTACRVCNPEQ